MLDGMREAIDGLRVERVVVFGSIKRGGGVDKIRAIWAKHKGSVRTKKMDLQVLDDGEKHWSVVFVSKK
jgi:hypothetical protein